jgi:WD40 repeat protein
MFFGAGKYLVSAGADGVLRVMDLAALEVVQEYSEHAESGPITHVAVSTDSHWLASADVTNTIHVFSLKKAKVGDLMSKGSACEDRAHICSKVRAGDA